MFRMRHTRGAGPGSAENNPTSAASRLMECEGHRALARIASRFGSGQQIHVADCRVV